MHNDAIRQLRFRQYYTTEMPALLGFPSKWLLNRELRPHRARLGKRFGNRWSFEQVLEMFHIFAIAYEIVQ